MRMSSKKPGVSHPRSRRRSSWSTTIARVAPLEAVGGAGACVQEATICPGAGTTEVRWSGWSTIWRATVASLAVEQDRSRISRKVLVLVPLILTISCSARGGSATSDGSTATRDDSLVKGTQVSDLAVESDGSPSPTCLEAARTLSPIASYADGQYTAGRPLAEELVTDLGIATTRVSQQCQDLGSAGGSAYYTMRNSALDLTDCLPSTDVVARGNSVLGDCGLSIVILNNGVHRVLEENP